MTDKNELSDKIILVIDDETSVLEAVKMTLKEKYTIITTACAAEALKYLSENIVDLALLDVRMREDDGIEVLRNIKKRHPDTTILMMTAHISRETMRIAMDLGAYGFIVKPFDIHQLRKTVDKALSCA